MAIDWSISLLPGRTGRSPSFDAQPYEVVPQVPQGCVLGMVLYLSSEGLPVEC